MEDQVQQLCRETKVFYCLSDRFVIQMEVHVGSNQQHVPRLRNLPAKTQDEYFMEQEQIESEKKKALAGVHTYTLTSVA